MSLESLTDEEAAILLALARELVHADGAVTVEERAEIDRLRKALGPKRFEAAVALARSDFRARDVLKQAAKEITDVAVRRTIYETLRTLAHVDGIDDEEEKPLRWLASWWKIDDE